MSDDDLDSVPDMPITRRFLSQAEWRHMPRMALSDADRIAAKPKARPTNHQPALLAYIVACPGARSADIRSALKISEVSYRNAMWKLSAAGKCHAIPIRGTTVRWYPGARP